MKIGSKKKSFHSPLLLRVKYHNSEANCFYYNHSNPGRDASLCVYSDPFSLGIHPFAFVIHTMKITGLL